jgi:hypothetical protein
MFESTKIFTDIAEKRSAHYNEIKDALDLVFNFIVSHKRIVYGGMSVDFALKMSGHKGIYADDTVPDYDFMSPDFYNDSNALAIELANAGFTNISSINAQHITTRRVRVNFVPVADITYIPPNIYETLPYLEYRDKNKKLRIIHPDFQRLDMHRAFSIPLENPPQEVFLFRAKKDEKRFRLLDQAYPINVVKEAMQKSAIKSFAIPKTYLQNAVIGGVIAYGFLYSMFSKLLKISAKIAIDSHFTEKELVISYPQELDKKIKFTIITDHFEQLVAQIQKDTGAEPQYYNKYLDDFKPQSIEIAQYEIFDNQTRKLPVFNCANLLQEYPPEKNNDVQTQNIWIAQVQNILLYLLLKAHECRECREIYLALYTSLSHMITEAETHDLRAFLLSAQMYGESNWSPDYIVSIREKLALIHGEPIAHSRPIFGFYPSNSHDYPPFDIEASDLFQIDGKLRKEPFKPITFN